MVRNGWTDGQTDQRTDGQTDLRMDRWKKWHLEVGAPPKKHASFILYFMFWEGTFVKCYDTATSSTHLTSKICLLSMTKNFCQFFLIKFISWFSLLSKTLHTKVIPFLNIQYKAEWNTNQNRVGIKGSWFMNHKSISWFHKPKISIKLQFFTNHFFRNMITLKYLPQMELNEWDWTKISKIYRKTPVLEVIS